MRRNRVAWREVIEDIGHDRIAVPVPAGRVYCKVASNHITGSVLAIAVLLLKAPRPLLIAAANAGIEAAVEARCGRRDAADRIGLAR